MKNVFAAAAVVLLVAPLLAGCLGNNQQSTTTPSPASTATLSPAVYKILAPTSEPVESASDGKLLENAVYRPDTNETVPVFINFSPYWGDTAMVEGDHFSQYLIHEYVPRGFAVVLSSVRGTGHSEGCFQIGGDLELKDAYDVIDHFSKQPWSNGNVGAGGKSYDSTTQNGVIAKFPHPALKTIFHVSGITDMYRYNAKDGVVYSNGLSFTPRYGVSQGTDEYGLPVGTGGGNPNDESPGSLARLVDDAACPEMAKHLQSGEGTAASGIKDAYWQERDWVSFLPESSWNGSVFFVHGLQDWNVKPDHIDPWLETLAEKGIEVKGWLHQETENLGHLYPMRSDWNVTMLRWLDHYLKDKENGIDMELGFDVQGSDKIWRHDEVWPPQVQWSAMEIGVGQTGNTFGATGEDERYAGVPYLKVIITPASTDGILDAVLYKKTADGTFAWVNEGVRRIALSQDLSAPAPYIPGMAIALNITMYPMDIEVAGDEQLFLQLNPSYAAGNPDSSAGFVIRPDQLQSISFGGATLMMPTVANGVVLSPQPTPTPCFAC